jgi:hypothetical protein
MRPGGALAAAGFPGCSGANGHDTAARARRAPNSARIIAGAFQPTVAYLTAGMRALGGPGRQLVADERGKRDDPPVPVKAPVADVAEPKAGGLATAQGVEGD